jgi:dTDP-4-amino-4,6-dideoxygalactose transaminase
MPFTEVNTNEILSLPLYPEMQDEDVERVCQVLQLFKIDST